MAVTGGTRRIVGGVDTHKDLHVAAVVDEQDRVIGTRSFATTRQGYRQMLAWMRSFGELQRIGIESTGSYGAGLLRFMQQAKVAVLEVTTPDKQDRRRRGKNDDLDAQNAAHAAFAGQRTVTPRSRDGMIESLRILMACRKTAVSARRVALQMIHNTIVCAPDGLRDQLRSLTRMQLVRTLASWRPDLTAYRDLDSAYRIGLKSLARRYLELHDEIADLDVMIAAIVDELAAIRARCEYPMQGGNEDGALHRKFEGAVLQQIAQNIGDAEPIPYFVKQQRPANALCRDRQRPVGVFVQRVDEKHLIGELGSRGKQRSQRSMTGSSVATSAVLPGHISVQIGRPAPSTISARIICFRSGR